MMSTARADGIAVASPVTMAKWSELGDNKTQDLLEYCGKETVPMDRQPINSSSINSVGYDPSTLTLEVEFQSCYIYQYFDVPESVYEGLTSASSAGAYLASNIKGVYRYART
jgi:hypothetical protein